MSDDDRTEAARAMGRAKTPKKLAALRENAKKRVYGPMSQETKDKIREAQIRRRRQVEGEGEQETKGDNGDGH